MSRSINDGLTNDQRWRLRNPEKRAAIAAKFYAAKCAADPEAERARARAQYAAHRLGRLEKKRAYYQNVRKPRDQTEDGRFRDRDRKARRRAQIADDAVTFEEWQTILKNHGNRCAYCPSDGPLEMDHVKALSKGGRHIASNIVPACKPCNSSKGAR